MTAPDGTKCHGCRQPIKHMPPIYGGHGAWYCSPGCKPAFGAVDLDPVTREGSRYCESGSLASGGTREYCTCDRCF